MMKVVNCTKCNEEYAIDLNKPEEWYCPYCDNLYSVTTDKLSVEKLQEIRVEELKDFNSKILQAELKNQKLQEQLNTAKKALTNIKLRTERDELETYYVERNHDIRKDAIDALAAIGGDDE